MPLHDLGGVVIRLQALCHLRRDLVPRCQIRVDEIIDMLEAAWLAEKEVFDTPLQLEVFDTLKPYQLTLMRAVVEGGGEALRFADTDGMPFGHFADDLDVCVLIVDLGDFIELAPVDIFIGVLAQQVHSCAHA